VAWRLGVFLEIALEEVIQEGSDNCDGGELSDLLPTRRDHTADDIRCELELETQQKPHRESKPDVLPLSPSFPAAEGSQDEAGSRLSRAECDHQDGDRLDGERNYSRDRLQ
jgi:hypothetical protein